MEFYAKLLQHKYFVAAAIAVSSTLALFITLLLMPHLTSILSYFWPLFLSTALVLVAIIVIGQMSPIPLELSGGTVGQSFLDYVAGHPESLENR
ncbi:hypothetical protein ACJIZ3_012839 [Penstemon smallii]|uniref:Transmembrane protein n=1 Tax=Penstemon smallii TaxID=265156 RepID=A0ABD3URR5_9LAMI